MSRLILSMLLAALPCSAALRAQPPDPAPTTGTSVLPSASIDDALEVTGDTLRARERETRLTIAVAVNGAGPFNFVVDSGADRSAIGTGVAARLALPSAGYVTLHSTSGTSSIETVRIDQLRIGTSEIDNLSAPALPERFLGADGLIGIDALADQRLLMDFDAHRITIQDTRRQRYLPALPDEIVVVARRRNGQLLLTSARASGVGIYAVIDSGSQITMGNAALRQRLADRHRLPAPQSIQITSVTGGVVDADLVVVPELTIGGIELRDVPIAFKEIPPFALFGLTGQPSILLGTDVLQAFRRVALDFAARKVRFQLKPGSSVRNDANVFSISPGR